MFKGLLIVIVSFFTLPIRFIRQTFEALAQIGAQGSVTPTGEERIPFLNWLLASGRVVLLLIGALQIVITPFLSGWQSRGFFGTSEFSFSSFLGGIVLGAIWAFLTIWWGAVLLELLSLAILLVNNTRDTVKALSGMSIQGKAAA